VRVCHCRLCQRWTGAPFFARAIFLAGDFSSDGETTTWPTSSRVDRCACARCGTPLFARPKDPPSRVGVSVASCDAPHALRPDCHIWIESKLDWLNLDDGLPQHRRGYAGG
jgi:hypothetical protein